MTTQRIEEIRQWRAYVEEHGSISTREAAAIDDLLAALDAATARAGQAPMAKQGLWYAMQFAERCSHEVSRRGELQPCNKPAVAVRRDPTGGEPYPVCPFHTRGDIVPLSELISAAMQAAG